MQTFDKAFDVGDWHVDVGGNRLLRGDEVRPLRHQAMALLVLLARHAGETVARDTIVQEVWAGNRWVADKGINTAVWALRQALGDDPDAPRYVLTVAKKGYRLIAPVRQPVPVAATAAPVRRRPWRWAAAAAAGLLLAGAAWLWPRPAPAPALLAATPLTQYPGIEYLGRLSPDGRRLAFAWWQGRGAGRLYVRTADRPDEPPRDLSGDAGDVEGLAWSPDGRTLAFTATDPAGRCTLWTVAAEGGPRRALGACAALFTPSVDWSPDGGTIAFSADDEGAAGLFAIAPDGSGRRRLTTAPPRAMADHQPAWSPDGRRLAFARQDPADGTRSLWELDLASAQPERVAALRVHRLHGLAYADDGRDLVYATTQQDRRVLMRWQREAGQALPLGVEGSAPARAPGGGFVVALLRSHVSLARWAGGAAAPERAVESVGSDREPHDHPAAPGAVFVSRRGPAPELWLAPRDGSAPRALTALGGEVAAPAWSPDGQRIAFVGSCGPGGRIGLCRLDLADGRARALATDAASHGRPAWQPDGRALWVARDPGGAWQLWRFDADGTHAQAVPTAQPPGRALQWAADGSGLVYETQDARALRWRAADGSERELLALPADTALVDWALDGHALVMLLRDGRERLVRQPLAGGPRHVLLDRPLGSHPERARIAAAAGGGWWLEVADTASADLLRLR